MTTHVARVIEDLDRELVKLDERRDLIQSTRDRLRSIFPPVLNSRPEDEAPAHKPRKPRAAKSVPVSRPQPRTEKQNRQPAAASAANGSGTLFERIVGVVYSANAPISTADIFAELKRLGGGGTAGSVGVACVKLAQAGKIARASRGYYQAPGAAKAEPPPASPSSKPTAAKGKHAVEPWAGAYRCSNCFEERERRTGYFKFACPGGAE